MLKSELMSILAGLGEIQGNLKDADQVELMRCCRRNLEAAAEMAGELENNLVVECPQVKRQAILRGLEVLVNGSTATACMEVM